MLLIYDDIGVNVARFRSLEWISKAESLSLELANLEQNWPADTTVPAPIRQNPGALRRPPRLSEAQYRAQKFQFQIPVIRYTIGDAVPAEDEMVIRDIHNVEYVAE